MPKLAQDKLSKVKKKKTPFTFIKTHKNLTHSKSIARRERCQVKGSEPFFYFKHFFLIDTMHGTRKSERNEMYVFISVPFFLFLVNCFPYFKNERRNFNQHILLVHFLFTFFIHQITLFMDMRKKHPFLQPLCEYYTGL